MGISGDQVKLVQDTWAEVKSKGSLEAHGLTLFGRLFATHPADFPKMFPFAAGHSSWADLGGTDRMKKHANGVVKAIDSAVGKLGDLAAAEKELLALGAEHKTRNVSAPYFQAVGDALLFTLEGGLGGKWSGPVKDAWTAAYGIISSTMLKGAGK